MPSGERPIPGFATTMRGFTGPGCVRLPLVLSVRQGIEPGTHPIIADAIKLVVSNVPLIMFVAAMLIATIVRRPAAIAERYLAWLLLLSVGIDGIWAGIFHIFFPGIASGEIGWQPSPFEFEIGVADLSLGIVAVMSFWRSLSFKSAIAFFAALFYAGVVVGHFEQAFAHGDYSPDNFGVLLLVTILRVVLIGLLLWAVWRKPKPA
jgi:hypothetical protein